MVDFARAAKINRALGYLPRCMGAPSAATEPCGKVDECLQCWFRKQMTLANAQPPAVPLRPLRQTHTIATLTVSPEAYIEIARLLRAAEYDHVFIDDSRHESKVIDMTGIGLVTT